MPNTQFFGASHRGPLHEKLEQPNEDAWLATRGAFGTLVAVSDGVGSRPHARLGARSSCLAARDAARLWTEVGGEPGDLPSLIEHAWLRRIAPISAADAAATCLAAVMQPTGRLVVVGAGDGMAVVKEAARECHWVVGPRVAGFGSETEALGQQPSWRVDHWEQSLDVAVVLATDGVSDDLLPHRTNDFIDWLLDEFGGLGMCAASRSLRRELQAWPTPRHLDDKTIAVLWSHDGNGSPR